jgi:ABC-type glutathione transport system ATPase component
VWLLENFALFFVLAVYLDNVLPSTHAIAKPFYFFLQPSYWRRSLQQHDERTSLLHSTAPSADADGMVVDGDLSMPASRTANGLAVEVKNLVKVYSKFPCGIKSKHDNRAVDGLSFSLEQGKLFCLLGSNGAGKYVLIAHFPARTTLLVTFCGLMNV